MEKENGTETDLSKAHRMAISKEDFTKLVHGDMRAAVNMLVYMDQNQTIKDVVVEAMYRDYLKNISAKMNGHEGEPS